MSTKKPKTTRLSKFMRECIRDELIQHRFDAEYKQIQKAKRELAQKMCEHFHSPEDIELMESLPADFLPRNRTIKVKINRDWEHFTMPEAKRMKHQVEDNWNPLDHDHPLAKEHYELERKEEDWKKRRNDTRAQVWAALEQVTTLNKLITV